jgi:hypothetical protein
MTQWVIAASSQIAGEAIEEFAILDFRLSI